MSNAKHETVADIVAEMRKDIADGTVGIWSDFGGEIARCFADRIEAAAKRESEATTEKSSAVGNAGTVQDIAQEMLNTSMQEITAERINEWATRLAACEQSVTDCNQLNNAAAMREALNAIKDTLDEWSTNGEMMEHWQYSELFGIANAAISTPPRNCDRFATLDDARNTFYADYVPDETCSSATAFAIWLFDKAKGDTE